MKKNLYHLLEISPEASPEEIKAAMIRLGKIYATKGQLNENARAYFIQIKKAYKILSSPYRRTRYDESLKNRPTVQAAKKLKSWVSHQWQKIGIWKNYQQQSLEQWKEEAEQQAQEGLKIAHQQARESWEVANQQLLKGWQLVKQQTATKYLSKALIPGETLFYQATTHWFFYLDVGAVLLVMLSSLLLIGNPDFITEGVPTITLWAPPLLATDGLNVSVWHIGLLFLLWVGLMILWEAFIIKQTTELAITSKRIIAKFGLFNRTVIELKLRRFESIMIEQSWLGQLFNYGTITLTGMGGVKTTVPTIEAPLKFKKVLWQVLEYVVPEDMDENGN